MPLRVSYLSPTTMSRQNPISMLVCLAVVMLGISAACSSAQAQSSWTGQSSGTPEFLTDVAFGAGLYVAVGECGAVQSSPDGVTWTPRVSGSSETFRGIVFAAGQFVAVGKTGTVITSTDGMSWVSRSSGSTEFLSGIAYGAGRFVAVGGAGEIITSTDGISWAEATSLTSRFLQGIVFADGEFLAFGAAGTMRSSTDGLTWVFLPPPTTGFLLGGSYFNGRYYVAGQSGQIWSSADLASWNSENSGTFEWLRSMATDGLSLIAVGDDGVIITSTDGSTWSPATSGVSVILAGAVFANRQFVVVGEATGGMGVLLTAPPDLLPPPPYDGWKSLVFDAAERADPLISGADADPDCDGLANIIEFVHALDPKNSDSDTPGLPTFDKVTGSVQWTHDLTAAAGVEILVRYSETLQADSWQTLSVAPEVLSTDGNLQAVRVVDPGIAGIRRRFYRLDYSLLE